MNLADMLCYADIKQLSTIADTYECESSSSHSKHELIQSILAEVHRKEAIQRRVSEMSLDDIRFLNSLLFEKRRAYSLEDLTARAVAAAGPEQDRSKQGEEATVPAKKRAARTSSKSSSTSKKPSNRSPALSNKPEEASGARGTIARFKRYGWLFNGISQQTRYLFHVPDDVLQSLREALDRHYRHRLVTSEEPAVYRDERGLLVSDVRGLLRFVQVEEVPLTSDGFIYKRQLQSWLDRLGVPESLPAKTAFRFGYGRRYREYPDRFSLLFDYAYFAGFIAEREERLLLTELGKQTLDGEAKIEMEDLYRFWLRLYKTPIPNLTSLVQWIARLSANAWVSSASMEETLLPLVRPFYYDSASNILEQRILKMMMHIGLLRIGESGQGMSVVRMTPQGLALVSHNEPGFDDALPWAFRSIDSG